jgi:hypothetical protein
MNLSPVALIDYLHAEAILGPRFRFEKYNFERWDI